MYMCTERTHAQSARSRCLAEQLIAVDCEGCSLSRKGQLTLVQVRHHCCILGMALLCLEMTHKLKSAYKENMINVCQSLRLLHSAASKDTEVMRI